MFNLLNRQCTTDIYAYVDLQTGTITAYGTLDSPTVTATSIEAIGEWLVSVVITMDTDRLAIFILLVRISDVTVTYA